MKPHKQKPHPAKRDEASNISLEIFIFVSRAVGFCFNFSLGFGVV